MVPPVQPLTSMQDFAGAKEELDSIAVRFIVPLPAEPAGEKYKPLAHEFTWRLERHLLPKWTPDANTVADNLYLSRLKNIEFPVLIEGRKVFIDIDYAMVALQLGRQKFIVLQNANGTIFITINPFAAKAQDVDGTKRELLEWMKNYFVRVPSEAAVKGVQTGANLRFRTPDELREEPDLSCVVTPRYLVFSFPLYLKGDSQPANDEDQENWIDRTNAGKSWFERYVKPSGTIPTLIYAKHDDELQNAQEITPEILARIHASINAKPLEIAALFQQLTGLDRTFVSPPAPDAEMAKEKKLRVANAFWYRLKNALQPKFIPAPSFIIEQGVFARGVEVGEAQKADMVYLPLQLGRYKPDEFRIAQTGDKVVISTVLRDELDLSQEKSASDALIAFMEKWMAWTPKAKDLVFDKIEGAAAGGYTARLARRARETAPFDGFHAVVTSHIISISLRKPSPDYAAARNATLDKWFALEK